ncbi:C40 family peptidase [Metaclostridioides mangenotii]|uniref:Cell wall-associated NlpC family hydrolase n=1 Tax=Metaclostridioides mangenotii TaxID=1540 RepID=A0ABS4E9Q8_9FIRM|nr:NlpC/P60 family protein [Clostridioides mangenotii]MBP1854646.1 cell wall-associated NlpC family hydrolase [Clostridioides mangenotii]
MGSSHVDARLLIAHFDNFYEPITYDEIVLSIERKGTPSKLEFTVVNDNVADMKSGAIDYFCEGNSVRLVIGNRVIWHGRIFAKKRDKQQHIKVTAYDKMFYLKKESYNLVVENTTASQIIYYMFKNTPFYQNANIGKFDDTKHKIPSVVFSCVPCLDAIQQVLDTTVEATQKIYTLFDDAGIVNLKELGNMELDYYLTNEVFEDYEYNSTIADSTYNAVCLYRKEKDTVTEKVVYTDNNFNKKNKETYEGYENFYRDSIRAWGHLAHSEEVNSPEINLREKALAMLRTHNQKFKTLTVKGCFGRIDVRAGCLIPVHLDLGDLTLNNKMMVENVKHKFKHGHHTMDMQLVGNEFVSSTIESAGRAQEENKTLDIRFNGGSSSGSGQKILNGKKIQVQFTAYCPGGGGIEGPQKDMYGRKLMPGEMKMAIPRGLWQELGYNKETIKDRQAQIGNTGTDKDGQVRLIVDTLDNSKPNIVKRDGKWVCDLVFPSMKEANQWGRKNGTLIISDGTGFTYPTTANGDSSMPPKVQQLINVAKTKIGCKYVYGAARNPSNKGQSVFDCSSFVQWCYYQLGIKIPGDTGSQLKAGTAVSWENRKPGDIIISQSSSSGSGRHVVLYIGNGETIEARGTAYGVVKYKERSKGSVLSVRRFI